MAQRRMFSLKIIDTDNFLNMPISARLFYYDLAMRADDDGFVDSPKKILKIIGCAEDDFKILCAKEYIIPFKTGVCVVKHWHVHNSIRSDRYNETEYKSEKQLLEKVDNKYSLKNVIPNVIPHVIPDDNQRDTQVRLGKVRLGEVKLDVNKKNNFKLLEKRYNKKPKEKLKIDYKLFELKYKDVFKQKTGEEPHIVYARDRAIIKSVVTQYGMEKVLKMLDLYFENSYAESKGFTIPIFKYNINSLLMEIAESNIETVKDPINDYIVNRICQYLKNQNRLPVIKLARDKMIKNAHSIIKALIEKDNPVLILASFAWSIKNDFWKDKSGFNNLETIGNQFVKEKDMGEYLEIYDKELSNEFGKERIEQYIQN